MNLLEVSKDHIITPDSLRTLCIDRDWYTRGTNEEYSELMGMCYISNHIYATLTTLRCYNMALNIMEHSDVEQSDETILSIMTGIANAGTIYYTLCGEDD